MEISGKVLREVEFRDRLRGYDTDEVDEFLEKVAVAVDELRAEMEQLGRRAERAEQRADEAERAPRPTTPIEPSLDDDAIRRTLVLAQRTADLAIAEAREEAARLLEQARSEADTVRGQAEDAARRARDEVEQDVHARLDRLSEERERLEREVQSLSRLVASERERLTEALSSALRLVGETLSVSDNLAAHASSGAPGYSPAEQPAGWPAPEPGPSAAQSGEQGRWQGGEPTAVTPPAEAPGEQEGGPPAVGLVPDIESEIAEDAASAYGGEYPPATGRVRQLPSDDEDGDEELWQRWAAGRDLGVVPGPSDLPRGPHRFGEGPGGGLSA